MHLCMTSNSGICCVRSCPTSRSWHGPFVWNKTCRFYIFISNAWLTLQLVNLVLIFCQSFVDIVLILTSYNHGCGNFIFSSLHDYYRTELFPIPAPKELSGESEVNCTSFAAKAKNLEVGQKVQYSFSFTRYSLPTQYISMLNHPLTAISKPACYTNKGYFTIRFFHQL